MNWQLIETVPNVAKATRLNIASVEPDGAVAANGFAGDFGRLAFHFGPVPFFGSTKKVQNVAHKKTPATHGQCSVNKLII